MHSTHVNNVGNSFYLCSHITSSCYILLQFWYVSVIPPTAMHWTARLLHSWRRQLGSSRSEFGNFHHWCTGKWANLSLCPASGQLWGLWLQPVVGLQNLSGAHPKMIRRVCPKGPPDLRNSLRHVVTNLRPVTNITIICWAKKHLDLQSRLLAKKHSTAVFEPFQTLNLSASCRFVFCYHYLRGTFYVEDPGIVSASLIRTLLAPSLWRLQVKLPKTLLLPQC